MQEHVMDKVDLEFAGRTLLDCQPRFFDGRWMMLEYPYCAVNEGSVYIVARTRYTPERDREFVVMGMFALQQDAMAWIHRKERYYDYRYLIERLDPDEDDDLYFKSWRVCIWVGSGLDRMVFLSGKLYYDMPEAEEFARYINDLGLDQIYAKVVPGYELE